MLEKHKNEWKSGKITEEEYLRLRKEVIGQRGRAVLTFRKSNVIKDLKIAYVSG